MTIPDKFPLANFPLFFFLASCVFATTTFATELRPFTAKFTAENEFITGGIAYLSLLPDKKNSGYDLVLQTKPTGILKFGSKGHIREHATMPIMDPFRTTSYSYTDRSDKNKNYSASFLRKKNEVTIKKGGKSVTIAIDEKVTDRLSMMLAVMQELQLSSSFTSLELAVLDGTRVRNMTFNNRGTETIETVFGNLPTVRVHRSRPDSNRETVTWFAILSGNSAVVPVKIEQFKRGKLTLRLKIIDFSLVE